MARVPTVRDANPLVWQLTKPLTKETLAICSSEKTAMNRAWQDVIAVAGAMGQPPTWHTLSSGSKFVRVTRGGQQFAYQIDPWPLDA